MKTYFKILIFIILSSWSTALLAQTYNNEWIDYSKTYYKFKLAKSWLYRISGETIQSLGLAATPGSQLQLWRNGEVVPIYVSSSDVTAPMTSTDYIEFWGKRNDGKPDLPLYKNSADQLDNYYSLETDSATFFLTVNTDISANKHYQTVSSTIPSGATAAAYCWGIREYHGHNMVNPGKAVATYGDYIYSSTYDVGEGWTSNSISPGTTYSPISTYSNINTSAGVTATLTVGVAGYSALGTNRTVNVSIGGTIVASHVVNATDAYTFSIPITDLSTIVGGKAIAISHNNSPAAANDRLVLSYAKLQYPRNLNFGSTAVDTFSMDASTSSTYLKITGYSSNGFTPILYDITNGIRYPATIQSNTLNYYLEPSSSFRQFVFVSKDNQSTAITNISQKTFTDYRNIPSDFMIITGSVLRTGSDPVEKYRAYRSSAAGGGYNAQIYDISQLEDQFAFGIRMHPSSVKNFLKYARNKFSPKPQYVLLMGHGLTYNEYNPNQSKSDIAPQAIIPTFGYPASDNILASDDYTPIPATPIGRLSVISPTEIEDYLNKLQEYESAQQSTTQSIDAKGWMKTAVHVAGGNDENQSNEFIGYLQAIENIISDTLMGYTVYNFNKQTNDGTVAVNDTRLRDLFKSGIGMINYWGHASSTGLDYNLDNPVNYGNAGKYPSFYVSGCDLMTTSFSYNSARMSTLYTVPEMYVLTPEAGSINFIAQSYLGVTTFMHAFNIPFFLSLDRENYNKPMSRSIASAAKTTILTDNADTLSRNAQVEQLILLGDPAVKVNAFAKPDFDIEDASVIVSPSYIDISQTKFHVKAYIRNLGMATGDSLLVQIRQQHPDGTTSTLFYRNIPSVRYMDSVELDVPINAITDKGQNALLFNLDPLNKYDELSKTNNVLNKPVFIYSIGLSPIYPYNYSIVNKQAIKLVASTANPIAPSTQYIMEIDTTALFNSTSKHHQTLSSFGGAIEFDPGIAFQDSTVYYWRVSDVPASGGDYHWNMASFLYLGKALYGGYNQSHLYQHLGSDLERIRLDSTSRVWSFLTDPQLFEIKIGMFPQSSQQQGDFHIAINAVNVSAFHCKWDDGIVFNIFDPKTLQPYYNQAVPSTALNKGEGGYMGSQATTLANCPTIQNGTGSNLYTNFEFSNSLAGRNSASQFMNWVPDGAYVVVRFFTNTNITTPRIPVWATDPPVNAQISSLYTSLKNAGFANIDQADYPRTWALIYQKDNSTFKPVVILTDMLAEQKSYTTNLYTPDSLGYITSPKFGPAKVWRTLLWSGKTIDPGAADKATIDLYGINNTGQKTYLQTINMDQTSVDISQFSAAQYPYMQMQMRNADSIYNTPYQLKYWRLFYDAVPEGALAANVYYKSDRDTVNKGADYSFAIAFKNISDVKFEDSIKVNYTLTDKNNVAHLMTLPKLKALEPGDTALIKVAIPGQNIPNVLNTYVYTGSNAQYLDVNPDNDQPEFTHVNNFLNKPLLVNGEDGNAALDITFDGVHILNNDIVSSKPQIIVKLSSDSKSQLLTDTSLLTLYLKYPDGTTVRRFQYGTDTLLFTAAKDSANNFALANFAPYLTQDGVYQLIVQGRSSEDATKTAQYSVSFQVYNKPMISDMFNYPNPFTTSTAFVFTLTGSVVPQNIRIEILTITGKIVKEITKTELGPLHIGRNITEYKWDGTDQYGQKLANGVYIYRVLTNLDGKKLDHFQEQGVNTSQYFNKGYGKMYLMR
ncbi:MULTISPECIES: putative type IX secretion system sortase PorU2 [Chitinophagaceae]